MTQSDELYLFTETVIREPSWLVEFSSVALGALITPQTHVDTQFSGLMGQIRDAQSIYDGGE